MAGISKFHNELLFQSIKSKEKTAKGNILKHNDSGNPIYYKNNSKESQRNRFNESIITNNVRPIKMKFNTFKVVLRLAYANIKVLTKIEYDIQLIFTPDFCEVLHQHLPDL